MENQQQGLNNAANDEFLKELYEEAKAKGKGEIAKLASLVGEEYTPTENKQETVVELKKSTKKINTPKDDFDVEYDSEEEYNPYKLDPDFDVAFDNVPLPSKGLCYKNGKSKIAIAYLTASDEDLITTPSLYSENKMIDVLLSKKILDKNINVENLIPADIEFLTVWLRATSYGTNFPITVTDPQTGKPFDTEVDLSKIDFRDFNLKINENGYFEFEMPMSKDVIEFKFMTRKDEHDYNKFLEKTNNKLKKHSIEIYKKALEDTILLDKSLNNDLKNKLITSLNNFQEYIDSIGEENSVVFSKSVTYRLFKSIVSINDNYDKKFIRKYVETLRAADSLALRKYINENAPAVNFNIEIQRPESLGGGSFTTFLQIDDAIFLNV